MAIGFGQLAILILGLVLREIPDWLREFMPGPGTRRTSDITVRLAVIALIDRFTAPPG